MRVLVTGHAGFIGFHTAKRLLERGDEVIGFDVINDYYDSSIKEARLKILDKIAAETGSRYTCIRENLTNERVVNETFETHDPERVINLAAQAGIRHSISHPHDYVQSNIVAFTNILEACRHAKTAHLTYASTSSVYGANTSMPFSEHDGVNHPLQFYAATKRANELMAHSYSHLYGLPTTGLRFFTVYGPWGRPDMAMFLFTKNILEGKPIQLFNHGNHTRDFTYIDDIVEGVVRVSDNPASANPAWQSGKPDPATSNAPWCIYNIGNNAPVKLIDYVKAIEKALNKKAETQLLPLKREDVPDTYADATELNKAVGYKPTTSIDAGVAQFVSWYRSYFDI